MTQKYKILEYFDKADHIGVTFTTEQLEQIMTFREELFAEDPMDNIPESVEDTSTDDGYYYDQDIETNRPISVEAINDPNMSTDNGYYEDMSVEINTPEVITREILREELRELTALREEMTITADTLISEKHEFENDIIKVLQKHHAIPIDPQPITSIEIVCDVDDTPNVSITTKIATKSHRAEKTLREMMNE